MLLLLFWSVVVLVVVLVVVGVVVVVVVAVLLWFSFGFVDAARFDSAAATSTDLARARNGLFELDLVLPPPATPAVGLPPAAALTFPAPAVAAFFSATAALPGIFRPALPAK